MKPIHYQLYHYWRSSASWRVRLALEYKNQKFETTHVGLLNGESESEAHHRRNPAGFVPVLELKTGTHAGTLLTESLAIIRFLEESHPEGPSLFPGTVIDHAKIWAMAEVINAGTQPVTNLTTTDYLSSDPAVQKAWVIHWIKNGLSIYEKLTGQYPGKFSYGDHFSVADVCLIPQIYNAERHHIDLGAYPKIQRIHENTQSLPAVLASHPDQYKPLET